MSDAFETTLAGKWVLEYANAVDKAKRTDLNRPTLELVGVGSDGCTMRLYLLDSGDLSVSIGGKVARLTFRDVHEVLGFLEHYFRPVATSKNNV